MTSAAASPEAYCRQRLERGASSMHYSLLFVAPPRRGAAAALYALSRELDEAVHRSSDSTLALTRLHWWAQEIERLFAGAAQHPVTIALAPHLRTYDLPFELFALAVQARHRILHADRFENFEELGQYAAHSAGAFGELAARVFGSQQAPSLQCARQLAQAVHLIRLVRDSGRLARAGRAVFAELDLRECGMRAEDLAQAHYGERTEALMKLYATRARQWLCGAAAGLPPQERRVLDPAIILAALYEALLDELARSRFHVLDQRIGLTPIRKLLIAWRTHVFGPARGSALCS